MIEVLDLLNSRIGYIKEYSDFQTTYKFDSWPEISFTSPANETYRALLQNEVRLRYRDNTYVIKDVKPGRGRDGSATIHVTAPLIAVDLNHKPRQVVGTWIGSDIYSNWAPNTRYKVFDRVKYYGVVYECRTEHVSGSSLTGNQWSYWTTCNFQAELAELVLTATDAMEFALADTGWSPGIIDDDGSARTFSGEWVSVPALLQEIAEKFDLHIVYNEGTRTIDMIEDPGEDHNVIIEYGKNLTGIEKSSSSTDFVTKLFLYGDEELTVNDVNIHGPDEHPLYQLQDHQSFIFNFSYFHSQGYTDDQIYDSIMDLGDASPFIRIGQLKLDSYIDEAALLAEGIKQMQEELSIPKVSYKVDFFNLAEALQEEDQSIGLGDWITVRDLGLGVDVKARVVSITVNEERPEESSAELSNSKEFFGNAIASTIQYNSRLSRSDTVNNLLKRYINTYNTTINSSRGDLVWKDGQLTSIELDGDGKPTGKQVRLTPGGLGVSTNFGVTYENAITGEGVLAEKVVADSIHILSIGADGLVIEPQSSGIRMNNTEGLIVQSADKRFAARLRASDDMSGTSYGFSLWNGDFDPVTIVNSGGFFRINSLTTDIPYVADYYSQVDANGRWYIFRKTGIPSTGPGVVTNVNDILYIDGASSGYDYRSGDIVESANGYWYVGSDSGLEAEYTGDSLVFGVSMNGDAYFKGEVHATSGVFDGIVYARSGEFSGSIRASNLYIDGLDILEDFLIANPLTNELVIGNIVLDGDTGNISTSGNLDLGGNITISGNIQWNADNSPVKYQFSVNGTTNWHSTMTESDRYRRDSLDGGETWGPAYQFRGEDGRDGQDGQDGSDASVTRANIARALLNANPSDGIYNYNGIIALRATAIEAAFADIQELWFGDYGTLYNGTGHDGTGTTQVAELTTRQGKSLVISSQNNIRISPDETNGVLYLDANLDSIMVGGRDNYVSLAEAVQEGATIVAVFG